MRGFFVLELCFSILLKLQFSVNVCNFSSHRLIYSIMKAIPLTENAEKELLFESSNIQVKMFVHNNPKDAEVAISQWLKENDVAIHHIAQSQSERGGSFVFVMTVFYQRNS